VRFRTERINEVIGVWEKRTKWKMSKRLWKIVILGCSGSKVGFKRGKKGYAGITPPDEERILR
jgi:hypothetical protein